MKLTCVLIMAVLFLTACQLITAASYPRSKQRYPNRRSRDRKSKLTKRCQKQGETCVFSSNCCEPFVCMNNACQ
uniref:Conotoxin n=1 Tax=Conus andremenezi TaxID=1077466 RepID=A0A291C1X4_9COND|nr:conotoxin [Conus andremenezi]ATF27454.1 conotoxin [Conus andremenezi]